MKNNTVSVHVLTGIIGLIAAILVGIGEFYLNFDDLARYSELNYDFMLGTSNGTFTVGHFVGVLSAPLYIVGCWHIYLMLKPANKAWAFAAFIIAAYGFMIGAVWIGSRASIGSLANLPDSIQVQQLIELYQLRYETLLTVIRVTTLVLSLIYIALVLTGKTHYPRWMAIFSPIILIVASFVSFAIFPALGKYPLPIALNVAFFLYFAASTWQASKIESDQD